MAVVKGMPPGSGKLTRALREAERRSRHLKRLDLHLVTGSPLTKAEEKALTTRAYLPSNVKGAHWPEGRDPRVKKPHSLETVNHGKVYKRGL